MLPNFFIIGAAKAGTTTLYHQLGSHPDIFFPQKKEPNFFSLNGSPPRCPEQGAERIILNSVFNQAEYEKLYEGSAAPIRGDASPSYLYSPAAPSAIATKVPDARIVVILRDPAERAFSAYLHMRAQGAETARNFSQALDAEPDHIAENWWFISHYLTASKYAHQLERYYDHFPRENIKIIDFEALGTNSAQVARDVAVFLGLSPEFVVASGRFNETSEIKNPFMKKLLVQQGFGIRALKSLLPKQYRARWKEQLKSVFAGTRPTLSRADRSRIISELEDDISRVERLTGLSFGHWRMIDTV